MISRKFRTSGARLLPLLVLIALAACSDGPTAPPSSPEPPGSPNPPEPNPPEAPGPSLGDYVLSEEVTTDPEGYAPLTARIDLKTKIPVALELRVAGRHGAGSDVTRSFPALAETHAVPVLGLYPDYTNNVELTLFDDEGTQLETRSYSISTVPASPHLPAMTIDAAIESAMAPGMTLVSYFGHAGAPAPNRPFIFDRFGDIRWYLDFAAHPELGMLSFDDGIERLANGNFYFGSQSTDRIYEVDMMGRVLRTWGMPGFGFHHQVLEKPDGNFLVTAHNRAISTIEDHVIEIDRNSGAIVNVWDLRQSLDKNRRTLSDDPGDWIHVNAVVYDESDDTIIVSGRVQGLIKLTQDNEVVWILGPHRGWETAGDGTDLATRLLQPLDAAGLPIADTAVLSGSLNHPDFEWNWYQHAPLVMPNGNVMMFDNGDNRNFAAAEPYSRAVEFEIDAEDRTVRQAWSYGKERGEETYSRIVSDVDYFPAENHVFFSPGAVVFGGANGKVIEMDRASREILFEATIRPPMPFFIVTFHRTERLSLYPDAITAD